MNVRKAGLVTAGVLAALSAVSPLITSTDAPTNVASSCSAVGAPNNVGIVGQCSDFGHDNYQGNGEGNTLNGIPIP